MASSCSVLRTKSLAANDCPRRCTPEKKAPVFSLSGGLLDSTGRATLLQASLADKMIEISLGQRLHELRDNADLSLRELARKVGVSSHSEEELALLGNATASREDGYSVPQCGTQSFEFSPSAPSP